MERIFHLILITSFYASIVGISIIILKALIKDKISPKWHYLLWSVLIIKLIIPFGPESTISLFNKLPPVIRAVSYTESSNQVINNVQNEAALSEQTSITPTQLILDNEGNRKSIDFYISYVWIIGAILMVFWLIYTNLSLYFKLKKYENTIDEKVEMIFKSAKGEMSVNRNISIVFQPIVNSPALFGIFKPRILFPTEVSNLNDKEISYILLHELAHYKRKDILANYILIIFQVIHWFNPIIWFCFKKVREDMELATDEKVLNILGGNEHKEYGKALLKVLESLRPTRLSPRLIGMVDDKKNMERRIRMIKMSNFFRSKRRIVFVIGILCIALMGGIFLTSGKTWEGEALTKIEEVLLDDKTPAITSYEDIYKYKTPYVGDNVKVTSLLDNLLYRELKNGISLEANNKPYGITVNYDFTKKANWDSAEVKANLRINSIILFTLIDNVDTLTYNIEATGFKERYVFTRSEIQKEFNKDLREYGKAIDQFQTFMNSLAFEVVVSPEKYAAYMSSMGIKLQPGFMGGAKTISYYTSHGKFAYAGSGRTERVLIGGEKVILDYGTPIYWIPEVTEGLGKEGDKSVVKIEVYNEKDKIIAKKEINIEFKNGFHTVIPNEGITIGGKSQVRIANPKTIDEAVHNAVLGRSSSYMLGEVATEGHVILDSEEKNGIVKVYTVASYGSYGFENGVFTFVSGSGAIPTVITFTKNNKNEYILKEYKEPMDGSYLTKSIKNMFPKELWDKALNSHNYYPEIRKQQEEQAAKYLESIGRKAKVASDYNERKTANINVEASNKIFSEYTKFDSELNRFPYWLGTREEIQDGVRYTYETSQSKTADGYDLITFTKKKVDGTVVKEYKYKIVGTEPQLIE